MGSWELGNSLKRSLGTRQEERGLKPAAQNDALSQAEAAHGTGPTAPGGGGIGGYATPKHAEDRQASLSAVTLLLPPPAARRERQGEGAATAAYYEAHGEPGVAPSFFMTLSQNLSGASRSRPRTLFPSCLAAESSWRLLSCSCWPAPESPHRASRQEKGASRRQTHSPARPLAQTVAGEAMTYTDPYREAERIFEQAQKERELRKSLREAEQAKKAAYAQSPQVEHPPL